MIFRSILFKIIFLVVLFNIAVWIFIIFSEDSTQDDIGDIRGNLFENARLIERISTPILLTCDLDPYEKNLRLENILNENGFAANDDIKLYPVSNQNNRNLLSECTDDLIPFIRNKDFSIMVTSLDEDIAPARSKTYLDILFDFTFNFYRFFKADAALTEPLNVSQTSGYHVIDLGKNLFQIKRFHPINYDGKTIAKLELIEVYEAKKRYLEKTEFRFFLLAGLTTISLVFGFLLAVSVAFPIRRLSKLLGKELKSGTVTEQLINFSIPRLEDRRDEIGSLYESLRKLNANLAQLFSEKESFAAEVTHEIKNPVAAIIAHADALEDKLEKDADEWSSVSKIKDQAKRINRLVTEISDAAVVDHDLVTSKRELFDFSHLLDELTDYFKEQAAEVNVSFTAEIQSGIKLQGLPERIAQVPVNLVHNALSFSKPGDRVSLTLSKRWRKGVFLIVDDSGPGVPEENYQKIFERFFSDRSDVNIKHANSGLGLYLVKQIVEAHGGQVSVDRSTLGGAKFICFWKT